MSTAMATVSQGPIQTGAHDRQLEALKRVLSQSTPKSEIRVRDGRGGQKLKYTDGAYVIRTLNDAFGWDWDFVADSEELLLNGDKPFEVKVRGILTVRMGGRTVTKTQYGCQPIEMKRDGTAPVSIGDCYKGAATDALKKCASLLGIALDLYDSDYRADKYEAEPQPIPPGVSFVEEYHGKPERPVRMEGAQPTEAKRQARGSAGTRQILGLVNGLKWTIDKLTAWMEDKFNYAIESDDLVGVFDSFGNAEQQKIIAALKGEFNNR